MIFVYGNKKDKSIFSNTGNYIGYEPDVKNIKEEAIRKFDGSEEDYSIFKIYDEEIIKRISRGDEYTLVWNEDDIFDIDFSIEDNKLQLFVTTNKNIVKYGVESVIISGKIKDRYGNLQEDFDAVIMFKMMTPNGEKDVLANIVAGKLDYEYNPIGITSNGAGKYKLPLEYHIEDLRVMENAGFTFAMPIGF